MAKKNPALGVVTLPANPPERLSDEVQYVGYRHAQDGELYQHDFRKGVELEADPDGSLRISHPTGRDLHRDFSGQTFLVNPPRRKPMARKAQPRHRSGPLKGKFKKRGAATPKGRKRNPHGGSYAAAPKRRAPQGRAPQRAAAPQAKRQSYGKRRSNPRLTVRGMTKSLMDGTMDAVLVLTGKAATRTIPIVANLPKEGNVGLAVQALTAVVVGLVAGRVGIFNPTQARMLLAGGLTGPLETLIVANNIPFLGPALSPVEGEAQMGAYVEGYVDVPVIESVSGVGGYADSELGMYDYDHVVQA